MNVLHICSDYPYTPIYNQLLNSFSNKHNHLMYVPLANGNAFDNKYDMVGNNQLVYSYDFNKIDRWFYKNKTKKIFSSINRKSLIDTCDFVHAHYLFSAGGVAYELKIKQGIDYLVAVRNTDINLFFKYGIHLRPFAIKILKEASKVVFISPTFLDNLLNKYIPMNSKEEILSKSIIIPNGVDEFWHKNKYKRNYNPFSDDLKLLFVGEFTANKNIETIIKVVELLRGKGLNAQLTLVGDGPNSTKINKIIANKKFVERHTWTNSKEELKDFYRDADIFVMPSFNETFGLVYIEALSQGLPLIYTRNQGIDGYFMQGQVGYACNPSDADEICFNIMKIMDEYSEISSRCSSALESFSWPRIARQYESIYEGVAI